MRRLLIAAVAVLAAVAVGVVVAAPSSGTPSGHAKKAVTIESWLLADPGATGTGLAGTVKACFKLSGEGFDDQGGGPTWNGTTYTSTTDLAAKCTDWTPVGGALFVPPAGNDGKFTLYAVHTITGQHGTIDITFAGWYYVMGNGHGEGTWVVTGGTGRYANVQGEGTWTAELGGTFPYIRHTETGSLWHR